MNIGLCRAGEFDQSVRVNALADHGCAQMLILADLFLHLTSRRSCGGVKRSHGLNVGFDLLMLHTCERFNPTLNTGLFRNALPTIG